MNLPDILLDTGFMVALNSPKDKYHARAQAYADAADGNFLFPVVAFAEAAFLIRREGGIPALLDFMDALVLPSSAYQSLERADIKRARDIMAQYSDSKLDFVDCCIMATAERLNITKICTFDRRDFSMVRPLHTPYFELLP